MLSFSSNGSSVLSSVGLPEASQTEAEAGAIGNKYISPRRLFQGIAYYLLSHGTRVQRYVTSTPFTALSTDDIINCNIGSAAATSLPSAASRSGKPLTIKDTAGQAATYPITITPNGSETIDGNATYIIGAAYQAVTLIPFNDGTNTGWYVI